MSCITVMDRQRPGYGAWRGVLDLQYFEAFSGATVREDLVDKGQSVGLERGEEMIPIDDAKAWLVAVVAGDKEVQLRRLRVDDAGEQLCRHGLWDAAQSRIISGSLVGKEVFLVITGPPHQGSYVLDAT